MSFPSVIALKPGHRPVAGDIGLPFYSDFHTDCSPFFELARFAKGRRTVRLDVLKKLGEYINLWINGLAIV
jgi:hypothetical protein